MTTNPTLTAEDLRGLELSRGAHRSRERGACLLEAVAWFAGEPHSDSPECVSPFLAEYGRSLNDRLDHEHRQQLKVFIPLMPGTAGDGLDPLRRNLAVDWAARVATPRLLDVAGLGAEAASLRALQPVTDVATRRAARDALASVRDLTWEARQAYRKKIADAVRAEYEKNPPTTTAVAAAVAAAVAVADAAAAAVAVAAAVAAAVAVADAAAAAAAVADAAAAAAAVADAAADGGFARWFEVYWAVRRALEAKWKATPPAELSPLQEAIALNRAEGIELLGRMINPGVA